MGRFSDAGAASEKRQGTKSRSGTRTEVAYREVTRVEVLIRAAQRVEHYEMAAPLAWL
jgi:hypothetical protein